MRYCKAVFLTLPLLFLWIMPALSAGQKVDMLESVSFQQISGKEEAVSFVYSSENPPKVFMISGDHPRIVVDFINTGCSLQIDRNMDKKGKMVKRIRVGIHKEQPPKTRVVVDLVAGAVYRYTKHLDSQKNMLILSIFQKEELPARTKEMPHKDVQNKAPAVHHGPAVQHKHVPANAEAVKPARKGAESGKPQKKETTVQTKAKPQMQSRKQMPAEPRTAAAENKHPQEEGAAAKPVKGTTVKSTKKKFGSDNKEIETNGQKKTTVKAKEKAESEKDTVENKSADKKPKALLSNVNFEKTSHKGEMVLFKLNDFFPPKVFGIEKGEPKVILDFNDTELGKQVKDVLFCNGKYVQSIRITKNTNPVKVRVVLHLVPHRNYDLQQVFFKEDNLFVVIVNSQKALPKAETKAPSKI